MEALLPHWLAFRSQNGSRFKNRSTVSTSSPPGARISLAAFSVEAMSRSARCSMVEMQRTAENWPLRLASGRVAMEIDVGPEASIQCRVFSDGIDFVLSGAVVEERIHVVDLVSALGQHELEPGERTTDFQDSGGTESFYLVEGPRVLIGSGRGIRLEGEWTTDPVGLGAPENRPPQPPRKALDVVDQLLSAAAIEGDGDHVTAPWGTPGAVPPFELRWRLSSGEHLDILDTMISRRSWTERTAGFEGGHRDVVQHVSSGSSGWSGTRRG